MVLECVECVLFEVAAGVEADERGGNDSKVASFERRSVKLVVIRGGEVDERENSADLGSSVLMKGDWVLWTP